jgi:hypothetical protein
MNRFFNPYSGKDALIVRGMIIEDDELIIERKLKRSLKKKWWWLDCE